MNEVTDHLHEASMALTQARLELHDVTFTLHNIADALIVKWNLGSVGSELHELADRLHKVRP